MLSAMRDATQSRVYYDADNSEQLSGEVGLIQQERLSITNAFQDSNEFTVIDDGYIQRVYTQRIVKTYSGHVLTRICCSRLTSTLVAALLWPA